MDPHNVPGKKPQQAEEKPAYNLASTLPVTHTKQHYNQYEVNAVQTNTTQAAIKLRKSTPIPQQQTTVVKIMRVIL